MNYKETVEKSSYLLATKLIKWIASNNSLLDDRERTEKCLYSAQLLINVRREIVDILSALGELDVEFVQSNTGNACIKQCLTDIANFISSETTYSLKQSP